jgi:glycosyltransferase involved in cell wall biosynthesis
LNILFLLSSLEPAGSETYSLSLAHAWQGRHRVFWISDQLHYGQDYLSLPIHQKAFPGGLFNTLRVSRCVRSHGIEIIHSHSRRAHWVAAQVSRLSDVPHVTTIHQPPPVHLFSQLFPCLGDRTIAIDEAVVGHLQAHFPGAAQKIALVRNGIDLEQFKPAEQRRASAERPKVKRILLPGRLSGGRWKAFQFFLDVLKRIKDSLPATTFQIAAHPPTDRQKRSMLERATAEIVPHRFEMLGFAPNLPSLLASADGVIAGGRCAMEGLACGTPVIVLGEGGVLGLCTPESMPEAMRSNFGDHLEPDRFYPATLELALRQLLKDEPVLSNLPHWGREQVEKHYNIRTIAPQIEAIYQCLTSRS